jgi:hypothetical protein
MAQAVWKFFQIFPFTVRTKALEMLLRIFCLLTSVLRKKLEMHSRNVKRITGTRMSP